MPCYAGKKKRGKDVEKIKPQVIHASRNLSYYNNHYMKYYVWKLPRKLKIELPYDSETPLLAICPKELKPVWFRDSYTLMHIVPF